MNIILQKNELEVNYNVDMNIRNAELSDLKIIMEMIDKGRSHISAYGIDQWQDGYPNEDTIREDIELKRGFILLKEDEIIGYYTKIDHDPCYDKIEGKWLVDEPYVAIHRTVVREFNKGYGSLMMAELKKRYCHIRIDTHEGNISMNKCLIKNGFVYCGIIYLASGDARNAYEFIG